MLPAITVSTAKMIRAQFLPAAVNAANNNKSTNRTQWFGSGLGNQVETDNATQTTAIAQMMNCAFRRVFPRATVSVNYLWQHTQ